MERVTLPNKRVMEPIGSVSSCGTLRYECSLTQDTKFLVRIDGCFFMLTVFFFRTLPWAALGHVPASLDLLLSRGNIRRRTLPTLVRRHRIPRLHIIIILVYHTITDFNKKRNLCEPRTCIPLNTALPGLPFPVATITACATSASFSNW